MLLLTERVIRDLVNPDDARIAIADAFLALHAGDASIANVISLPFENPRGVAHIKAGHVHADAVWTAKVSADFYPAEAATVHAGLMLVLSSVDGSLIALLLDGGYLTELRTGAAGAVSAELLARRDSRRLAIIGAGNQARYQLEALLRVRTIDSVHIASRTRERADAFAGQVSETYGLRACVCDSVEEAVAGADIVITATPSPDALIAAPWLARGVHVIAVGSDEPTKQELAPEVLGRADVVAVDDVGQASRLGELHHALDAGLRPEETVVTLGALIAGDAQGRTAADDVTVADLTGVGVQDAAIAALVVRKAIEAEIAQVQQRPARKRDISTVPPGIGAGIPRGR